MPKKFLVLTLAAILAGFILANKPKACTGAEAAAQGYSTLVTEETANSVYGNMAGLAFLEKPEVYYTHMDDSSEQLEMEEVVDISFPLGKNYGVGFQYWHTDLPDLIENRIKISAGSKIYDKDNFAIAIGGEINLAIKEKYFDEEKLEIVSKRKLGLSGSPNLYLKYLLIDKNNINDELRIGILFQGFNNIRPGISNILKYEIMNVPFSTKASLSYYDLLGGLNLNDDIYELIYSKPAPLNRNYYGGFRFGIEQKLGNFAVRAGIDNSVKSIPPRMFAGIGLNLGNKIELDYTKEFDELLKDVSFIGVKIKF